MPREPQRIKVDRRRLQPRVKVWLELDGEYVFGHGLSEILQAVAEQGSIKDAAASLGKSYRYVWGRVKKAERAIGEQLVETRVGGLEDRRSRLTPLAEKLLADFVSLRRRMFEIVEQEFAGRFRARN
jgi:molybdate transport system regulatory protein